jgi:ABC-type transporter Mla subunit MlaD
MARQRRSELTAGVFVLLALGVTAGVVLWLGAADLFKPERQRALFFVKESAGSLGLQVGNEVHINDRPIGELVAIRYDAGRAGSWYEVQVEQAGVEIHSDAEAVVAAGLVGEARLVIVSRGSPGEPLADEDHPAGIRGGLDAAMRDFSVAAGDIRAITSTVRAALAGPTDSLVLQKVVKIVEHMEEVSATAAEIAKNLLGETDRENGESMLARLRHSVQDINAITANIRRETQVDQADTILGKADRTMTNVASLTGTVRREMDAGVAGSVMAKVHETMDGAAAATGDAKAITADARPKISKLLSSAESAVAKIEGYTRKEIPDIFAELRQANTQVLTIANDLADVSSAARKIVVLNRENVDHIIENMTQVSESLKASAREIRRSPWRLLRKPKPGESQSHDILAAASAFSAGASSLDRALTKLKGLDPKTVSPDDPELKRIREHLDDTFRKFKKVEDALWEQISAESG